MNNKIIVLVGASGSGKTTIGKELEKYARIFPLVSCTTRGVRDDEVNGIDYHFITRSEADFMVQNDYFIEYTVYNNEVYGLESAEVYNRLSTGKDVYFISDYHGAEIIADKYPDQTLLFYVDIDTKTMYRRMVARGDSYKDAEKRVQHAIKNNETNPPADHYIILDGRDIVDRNVAKIIQRVKDSKLEHKR